MIHFTKVKYSKWDELGMKFIPWVIYTTWGNIYIWVSVVKPCIDPDVHLVFQFAVTLQWNCPMASRFYFHQIGHCQQYTGCGACSSMMVFLLECISFRVPLWVHITPTKFVAVKSVPSIMCLFIFLQTTKD